MSSGSRSRRRELVEEAYNIQVKAGLMASRNSLLDISFNLFDLFVDPPPSVLLLYMLSLSCLIHIL
jgi:hypothetical protein